MSLLGLHTHQDDDSRRQRPGRGSPHPRTGRRGSGSARLGAGRPPDREQATDTWDDKVAVDRFTGKGGHFVRGRATITGPGRIRVGEQEWVASRGIVVATGTTAVIPPIEGLAGTPYWTNREAVEAETLPDTLLVLGGGAIGLELSQVMARFGVQVTVIEGSDRLLAMEEPESSETAAAALAADGIKTLTGVRAQHVTHSSDGFSVQLSDGSTVTGERLLVA